MRGPIFIVSPMGSGSTLPRLILDSHENIAIPHETARLHGDALHPVQAERAAQRLGWSDDELDAEARRFFERIFMRYAEQHGKRRWGEKTPQHTWHIAKMKRVLRILVRRWASRSRSRPGMARRSRTCSGRTQAPSSA